MSEALRPYVPRLVIDWLAGGVDEAHRQVDGTLVFADISGFTALTEKLAAAGKAGAEEMGTILNATFDALLEGPYEYGAGLLKWGGDAVLLLFTGEQHARRATRAACVMQQTIRRVGRIRSSGGAVTLRMSIGVHSGPIDLFLVGTAFRELVVTGPSATAVAQREALADAGQIVVSESTASLLPASSVRPGGDGRLLLVRSPLTPTVASEPVSAAADALLERALPRVVAEHIASGQVDAEHRQVATVFVEFSGVDELLASAGPETVAPALTHVLDVAAEVCDDYHVTLLASDLSKDGGKLLLVAGVPASPGDLEERAVCAARAIVDRPGQLTLRAGVSRGRVYSGDFGPPYRRTFSVVADSVNLGARLMGRAGPGQVVAGDDVLAACRGSFPTTPLEPFLVKGKSQPVQASTVDALPLAAAEDSANVLITGVPFVGRDQELAALDTAWSEAQQGNGSLLDVVGEAGVGKSRLFEQWVARTHPTVLAVRCDVFSASRPYWAVGELLRRALEAPELNGQRALDWLTHAVTAGRPELLPWLPLVGPVLNVQIPATPEVEAADDKVRLSRLAELVVAALDSAVSGPVTLVVGDLHHADSGSLEVLRQLAPRLTERPWLVLTTRRDHGPLPVHQEEHALRLPLAGLLDHEATSFVELMTEDAPITSRDAQRVVEHAGGNPLFLLELVASRRDGEGELPDSVESAVASRVDRLPPRALAALRALSVLGVRADRAVADDLLRDHAPRLSREEQAALEPYVEVQERYIAFRQTMVREAAYAGLPFGRRRRLHAAAAGAIRAHARADEFLDGLLAVHLEAALEHAAAQPLALSAAERALASLAFAEAAAFLERAIRCTRRTPGFGSQLSSLASRLGRTYGLLGEPEQAQRAYKLARRHAETAQERAVALAGLAECALRGGTPAMVLRWVTATLAALADTEPGPERGSLQTRAHAIVTFARLMQGRPASADEWATRGLVLAAEDETLAADRAELHRLRAEARRGQPDASQQDLREALRLLESRNEPRARARVRNDLGVAAYYGGRWDEAAELYSGARSDLLLAGAEYAAAYSGINLVELLSDQGRWAEATELGRPLVRYFRSIATPDPVAHASKQLGVALARSGATDSGLELLAAAEQHFRQVREETSLDEVIARQGEAHVLAGQAEPALLRVDALLAQRTRAQPWAPVLHRVRGQALMLLSQWADARQQVLLSLMEARAVGARHEIAYSLDVLEQLDGQLGDGLAQELSELRSLLGIVAIARIPLTSAQPVIASQRIEEDVEIVLSQPTSV